MIAHRTMNGALVHSLDYFGGEFINRTTYPALNPYLTHKKAILDIAIIKSGISGFLNWLLLIFGNLLMSLSQGEFKNIGINPGRLTLLINNLSIGGNERPNIKYISFKYNIR
jgi:hypothetical protein